MRPRPEDRGERRPSLASDWPCRIAGFNAATARRPWRTIGALCIPRRQCELQCGHGPKTVENFTLAFSSAVGMEASMRPRPEDRGEPWVPVYTSFFQDQLQCGHGPKTVENGELQHQPRRGSRGFNAATARRPWRTLPVDRIQNAHDKASMRPRPEDRGERGAVLLGQLGNGSFNAATARRPWRTGAMNNEIQAFMQLQCGHGPKTVENTIAVNLDIHWQNRFNAATARRPWRTRP